jgi:hypothetical protein
VNTLHEQQRRFAKCILASDDERHEMIFPNLKCTPSSLFTDAQRLQVYRNNFAISLREALVGVYPVLQKLVGEAFFQQVAREYVQRYPSRTGNLHDFGDAFADFLNTFPSLEDLPYLPDVARLEWAHHQVFHAVEDNVLNLESLAALTEEQMAGLRFQLSSNGVYLASDYPILRIWQTNQDGHEGADVSLDEGGVQCVVLRHGEQIEFHPLDAGVYALIGGLAQDKLFSQACEEALAADANCDIAAALQFLVGQKLVSGFSL